MVGGEGGGARTILGVEFDAEVEVNWRFRELFESNSPVSTAGQTCFTAWKPRTPVYKHLVGSVSAPAPQVSSVRYILVTSIPYPPSSVPRPSLCRQRNDGRGTVQDGVPSMRVGERKAPPFSVWALCQPVSTHPQPATDR